VGRLSYDWKLTPVVDIAFLARRELGAQADLVDNYVVTESVSVTPTWWLTPLLSLGASAEWRQRDYGGDPGFDTVSVVVKDDETYLFGLSASYLPRSFLQVTLGLQQEQRTSDNAARDYDDRIATLSVQLIW